MVRSRANLHVIRPAAKSRAAAGSAGAASAVALAATAAAAARPGKKTGLKPEDEAEGSATQRIVNAITSAVVERRLMPGTKLVEQQIADLFKVSRTIVRQALNRLSEDHLVTLEPARGAFVAQPSIDEARQVFELRAMLETSMVRKLCAVVTDADIEALRAHLRHENDAVSRTDVPGRTRLLADFHVVLAQKLGNQVLADLLADLLSRSSLIALMYQSAHSAQHSADEHVAIVDALAARDARAAAKLMENHLGNVKRNLQLHPRGSDLAGLLRT